MKQRFYLDRFDQFKKRAIEARRRGDLKAARQDMFQAAEMLLKLAAASTGELKEVRKQKARQVLEAARSMEQKAPRRASPAGRDGSQGAPVEGDGDRWIVTRSPGVSMDDVAGLDDVKGIIRRRVIYPFQHPEVSAKYRKAAGGGVLLYGPPGTGKTMMAKAIASEVDATFFAVKCSDIMSKWVGEAEQNLKDLFSAAREHERAVLFLDEAEAICARRGSGSTVMDRLIPEFLSQVDGLEGRHAGLLLLGATNRPWDMDDAALRPGRFGELIYVPLPDRKARGQIIAGALAGIPLAQDAGIEELSDVTEGYSGADLVGLCETIKDGPYEREIQSGAPQQVEADDVRRALDRVRPSVSQAQHRRYRAFQRDR